MFSRSLSVAFGVMLLILPCGLLAETRAAIATVSGAVSLNGSGLADSGVIFPGDLLETGANSALSVNAIGSAALIGANSRVHYFADAIELDLGTAQINTSQGMTVEADTVKIGPSKGSAKFRVDRTDKLIVVSALENDLRVDNDGQITVVPQGTSLTLERKKKRRPAGAVYFPDDKWIFFGAAAVTGGTIPVIWDKDKKAPISNQIP